VKPIRVLQAPTPGLASYRNDHPESRNWDEFHDDYRSGQAYKELVGELVDTQRGLCAYCEIDLIETDRQVEHFHPKSDTASDVNWTFEPSNLFVACKGGTNPNSPDNARRSLRPSKRSCSCGEAKGNKILGGSDQGQAEILKPSELPAFPCIFQVFDNGRIRADSAACAQVGIEIETVEATIRELNLDCERLRIARSTVWEELLGLLPETVGDDAADYDALKSFAEPYLLPELDGRLGRFFTTVRSFFGEIGDRILRETDVDWI
jgi:uncharacterized protein (TIGR02646 family)